ncbi:MAG TPA: helix-turn-helix transcriptional regulator [Oscillatoriales cyanobacterium M59_W2019_021]|nr:MAG: XRE family transcriptional regulator [Cyanobacteria bacterium J055]HIK30660.1 helix-turn-helix transcriptional regulator [Oscillatoriales cyanobacterium M4454_W2019_049]HIK52562.1 helix-turn-helix transcriptional regulator [Oscillatoriales cyanobacterium M59_W2019_021]
MDLKALRDRVGIKLIEVANILQCSESSIRNWEKGRTTPKMEVWQVFRLRDLYRCSEAELEQAVRESIALGKK